MACPILKEHVQVECLFDKCNYYNMAENKCVYYELVKKRQEEEYNRKIQANRETHMAIEHG